MTVQEWLGNNQLGIDIWQRKYQRNNETFDEWVDRVSGHDAEVGSLIREKKFLFGGRILSNRGVTDEKVTYSNCYVIAPPEDNLESIYDCAKKLARTFSYGGGCGIDISKLSPAGAKVNNQAKSTSGAVSFMDTFSQVTQQIGQNGRRGALMISIDCTHPDLEKFISVKNDLNKVTSANISVRVSDAFMKAVENDEDWKLSFTRKETGEIISKVVKAKDIFYQLCDNNYDYAEPGILYWDLIKQYNMLSEYDDFEYAGVNPCVTGDTLISTTDGEIPIKELVGKTPDVYCMDEDGNLTIRQASKVWKTRENAATVCVHTHRGVLHCTPDHLIYVKNRGWVRAEDLKHGDKLVGLNRMMKDETHVAISLSGGEYVPEHRFVAGYYTDISGKIVHHIDGDTLNNRRGNLQVMEATEHNRISNLGRKIEVVRDEKGRYVKKTQHKKRHSFNLGCGSGTNWIVDRVEYDTMREDVYDMTVPGVHNFVANRMVVHNCAEEPLPAGGSCLLGSINLSAFVEDGKFNMADFANSVKIAVDALNDVLDEGNPLHPLEEQRQSVHDWRQIGLGIMGLADMLIGIGLTYGSKEAVDFCNEVGECLARTAIEESLKLAMRDGAFPKCVGEKTVKSSFIYRNVRSELIAKEIEQYGLRNSQLLTIAPTGTLSTMLGISGGIEPIFANSYTRKTQSLHGEDVTYKVYTPIVEKYMKSHGIDDEKLLPEYFVTAKDIAPKDRIAMQAIWQDHIDASISSTINLPNSSTVENVYDIYMTAWKEGLKGITVYRSGCKREGILVDEQPKKKSTKTIGLERHLTTGCGSLHVCAFFDEEGNLKNTYLSKGSTGGCNNFMIGLSRMISLAAREGVGILDIVDQLKSSGTCPSYAVRRATKCDTSDGSSCPVAVGNALIDMWNEVKGEMGVEEKKSGHICPECGAELVEEMGCVTCKHCGYSKCG